MLKKINIFIQKYFKKPEKYDLYKTDAYTLKTIEYLLKYFRKIVFQKHFI